MLNLASVTWHLQLFGDNGEGYVLTRFDDRLSVARTSHVSDGRKLPGALGQQVVTRPQSSLCFLVALLPAQLLGSCRLLDSCCA